MGRWAGLCEITRGWHDRVARDPPRGPLLSSQPVRSFLFLVPPPPRLSASSPTRHGQFLSRRICLSLPIAHGARAKRRACTRTWSHLHGPNIVVAAAKGGSNAGKSRRADSVADGGSRSARSTIAKPDSSPRIRDRIAASASERGLCRVIRPKYRGQLLN